MGNFQILGRELNTYIFFILVAQCFWPVSAQIENQIESPTLRFPNPDPTIQQAIDQSLGDLAKTACDQAKQGKLKSLYQTEVPESLPFYDELQYFYESLMQLGGKVLLGNDIPSQSLTYLLFESAEPSKTGIENPFVKHTLGSHGSLGEGQSSLPSSRELDLAIKVMKSNGEITPSQLFGMSLEVTKGDVPSALLTCHNLLKEVCWSQRNGDIKQVFLRYTMPPPPTSPSPYKDSISGSTIDITQIKGNQIKENDKDRQSRMKAINTKYTNYLKKINMPFTTDTSSSGEFSIYLEPSDTAISDKLKNLRPSGDKIVDKMGPWYHTFGIMFLGSYAVGGENTAKL